MAGDALFGPAKSVDSPGAHLDETRTAERQSDAVGRRLGDIEASPTASPADWLDAHPSGLAPRTRVGRYEIVELIGRGGSGVVYRAYDPELSRSVALKVIASAAGAVPGQTQARLLEEAQILARLSHPNIVAAYDIGTHDGFVYIVMELVDGVALSEWLRRDHTRAALLDVLIAAGRGLAAAHAAGVVHRDFKPANVMVSRDGRVRVVDFGLARRSASVAPRVDSASSGPAAHSDDSGQQPGESSALSGTPGYIAPEQFLGKAADGASDQFSFAVTAFVGLVGAKPYPIASGPSASSLPRAAAPMWPPSVPRKLRHIVNRGLALRAEQRYPSVAGLVADLERAASPFRRRPIVLGALGVLVAACASWAIAGGVSRDGAARAACSIDDSAFRDVWDPARRAAVEQAFRATGRSNASEALALVSQRLDAFEAQWISSRRASCEATLVRREQSERVMAQRDNCLQRAREAAKTMVGALTEVDAATLDGVAGALPPSLTACSESALHAGDVGPTDPALRAKVDEVELGIAVTAALISAARGPQAIERATHTLELARSSAYPRAIAAATAQLARARLAAARTVEEKAAAEALFREAVQSAAAAGDDALVARTSSALFVNIAYAQRRIQDAEAMLPAVEAVITLAGNEPAQRTELLMGKASILTEHMQLAEAIDMLDEVVRLAPSLDNEVRQYGINASSKQASIYSEIGNHEAAIAAQRRAVDGLRETYGASHPRLLVGLVNLARMQSRAKQREPALQTLDELLRLAATLPPNEPRLENLPQIEGEVWQNLGECGRAVPFLREAVARFSAAYGADHPRTTDVLTPLGTCLADQHQSAEAISYLERALQSRRARGETPSSIAFQALDLAKVLRPLPSGRIRASALVDEAKALWRQDGVSASKVDEWLAEYEAGR